MGTVCEWPLFGIPKTPEASPPPAFARRMNSPGGTHRKGLFGIWGRYYLTFGHDGMMRSEQFYNSIYVTAVAAIVNDVEGD